MRVLLHQPYHGCGRGYFVSLRMPTVTVNMHPIFLRYRDDRDCSEMVLSCFASGAPLTLALREVLCIDGDPADTSLIRAAPRRVLGVPISKETPWKGVNRPGVCTLKP